MKLYNCIFYLIILKNHLFQNLKIIIIILYFKLYYFLNYNNNYHLNRNFIFYNLINLNLIFVKYQN